jgi:P-type conjugative transfer protein TrbJ
MQITKATIIGNGYSFTTFSVPYVEDKTKNNIMKTIKVCVRIFFSYLAVMFLGSIMVLLCFGTQSHAYTVYCTNCSEVITQALERATSLQELDTIINQYTEDVQQTAQQIRMVQQNIEQYQNMLQNTKNLSPDSLSSLAGEFRKLSGLQRQIQLQRGDAEALRRVYGELYPGMDAMAGQSDTEYEQRWNQWTQESDRAWQSTFQMTGRQLQELEQDADTFDQRVQELLTTPEGRMEAAQSANQLAALQLREAREMRSLMNAYIQAQTQAASKAAQVEQAQMEESRRFFNTDKLKGLSKVKAMEDPR